MLRSRVPAFLLLTALLWSCSEPGPVSPAVVEIGLQPQVLVDDFILERTEALRRRVNPLEKHAANPVLSPRRPWEGRSALPTTVLFDDADRRFKMWYQCRDELSSSRRSRDRWAYAVSGDGITWEKPNLGLASFAGSRRNNLIPYPVSRVLLDFTETDPERRFKALAYDRINEDGPAGILVGFLPTVFVGACSRRVPSSPRPGAKGRTPESATLIRSWAGMNAGTGMLPSCDPAAVFGTSASPTAPTSRTGAFPRRC